MRRIAACFIAAGLAVLSGGMCFGFYSNIDSAVGGPMTVVDSSGGWVGDGNIFEVQFLAKNTGEINLPNVGLTTQFVGAGEHVFSFDNIDHRWVYQNNWLNVYGVGGQNDLLSMDRAVTDVPLSWALNPASPIATLLVTDSVPVLWLGDVAAGQTIGFSLYFETSERFYADAVGFFVTPEPATLMMIGTGVILAVRRRTKNK